MDFAYTRRPADPGARLLTRILEIVPGMSSWSILLGTTALAFAEPLAAAAIIIAFNLYWLFRLFYMTLFLILACLRLAAERDTDWMARVREAARPDCDEPAPRGSPGLLGWISRTAYRRQLRALRRSGEAPPSPDAVHHVVLLPVAKEPREVIEPAIEALSRQRFPSRRILLVLAVEERAPEAVRRDAEALAGEYAPKFLEVLLSWHPDGVPGEARVKGANITHAARAAAAALRRRGMPFEQVVVSCLDADTIVGPDYFACLTFHFLVCPDRLRASFQPIPVYHNNIWQVPAFARVLETGASFFQLVEATDPERMVTFSSHSMSFQALVDVGYWPVEMISDDSAIFWKALIHYDGRYRVVPMYVTVSMDVAAGSTWRRTARQVYRQKRRWAWGVENFPVVMRAFLGRSRIPLAERIRHGFKLFEGHVAWATWAFLLTIIGWLPALFAGREFSSSVAYYSVPRIAGLIFNLATLALAATVVLSVLSLPPPAGRRPFGRLGHVVEWLGVPVFAVLFSAVPALDAQTRLMFGRELAFHVADKTGKPALAPQQAGARGTGRGARHVARDRT